MGAYEFTLPRIAVGVDLDPTTLNVCNLNGWAPGYGHLAGG